MRALPLLLLASAALAQDEEPPKPPEPKVDWEARAKEAAAKGAAAATGEMLGGEPEAVTGAEVVRLSLPAGEVRPAMVWTDDGDAVVVAEKRGVVRRIAVPSLREERRLWVGAGLWGVAQAKGGILLGVPEKGEVWVLNQEDLSVLQKIPAPDGRDVVGLADEPVGFVARGERGMNLEITPLDLAIYYVRPAIVALELMKQQAQKTTIRKHPSALQLSQFELPTAAPNGKHLFFATGGSLHRFRVQGQTLVYEEAGPRLGKFARIEISPDSNYVAAPSAGEAPADIPALAPYGTYVFRTNNLQKPEWLIPEVRVVGFTRSSNKVFGLRDPGTLGLFSNKGTLEKSMEIGAGVVRVLVHPESGKLLVLRHDGVLWVTLK